MATKAGRGEGWIGRLGLTYTHYYCIAYITSENLLFTSGNSAQGSVVTSMARKSAPHTQEGIYIYSLYCPEQTNTTL